ncbi:hypothetical protein [Methylobacterium nigriterrae]|uniref:hypothetical protein n=1 Tax=Methylobacterium nigriterrae TaxID=3127512 RepID=UPI00301387FC
MSINPTTSQLVKAHVITEEDLQSALDAFEADPEIERVELGGSYSLNPHAAIEASSFAQLTFARAGASSELKRSAVRTAILLARPEKR